MGAQSPGCCGWHSIVFQPALKNNYHLDILWKMFFLEPKKYKYHIRCPETRDLRNDILHLCDPEPVHLGYADTYVLCFMRSLICAASKPLPVLPDVSVTELTTRAVKPNLVISVELDEAAGAANKSSYIFGIN